MKVENMPPDSERPRCPGCGAKAKFYTEDARTPDGRTRTSRTFSFWRGYTKHHFCTLTCAARYAAYMFERHGTRLTIQKKEEL